MSASGLGVSMAWMIHLPQGGIITVQERNELVLWAVALLVGMIILFFVQKVVRAAIDSKVRGVRWQVGIAPDTLDRMSRTGLLSEEEMKKVRQAIARAQMEEAKSAIESRQAKEKGAAAKPVKATVAAVAGAESLDAPPREARPPVAEPARTAAPSAGRSSKAPAEKAGIHLEDLLARGLITREEYERLRSLDSSDT